MPILPEAHLRFTIRVEGVAPDLPFLGPTVRGLLGYGLRQHCCGHAALDDGRCSMGDACTYGFLFEGPLSRRLHDDGIAVDALPQPFVTLVDPPSARRSSSNRVAFGIRLLGTATALASDVAAAIRARERFGFGARSLGFTLESVSVVGSGLEWHRRLDPTGDALEETVRRAALRHAGRPLPGAGIPVPLGRPTLRWLFRTPVALGELHPHDRRADRSLPESLLLAVARRAWMLERAYSEERLLQRSLPQPIDSGAFRLREARLSPIRVERRSTRHGRTVTLDGTVGSIAIEGPWSEHAALLAAASRYGVGRNTSFGFGQVELEFDTTKQDAARDRERPSRSAEMRSTHAAPLAEPARVRSNTPRWVRLRGAPPPKSERLPTPPPPSPPTDQRAS